MTTEPKVGLVGADGRAVALAGVRIDASLTGSGVEVTVTQRYRNAEAAPIEAVYVFPLEEGAAVCGFAARVGGAVVRGRVEDRESAFARYDDAMMDGHGAFLLDQERPDVFTASVGNLRPGEQIELQIRYVALARREGDALRLSIPTTVSPRYVPRATAPEVGEPDGERVNPERWPSVPYGLALSVDVELGRALRRLESPSHPIRTTLREGGARVELSQEEAALDRDVVLLVEPEEPARPMALVASEPDGRRVAMVTFLPELPVSEGGHEVIFVLDCSGSMGGSSIEQAKRALQLCVRALGPEDTFDIVRFGSEHAALWGAPRRFDEAALDEATRHVASIRADLGGTEILAPMRSVLERRADPSRPRRVLLLTDGQVANEAEVIALARDHASSARVFTFGIGAGASEHLVRGVARASRGASEMIAPGERIEPKVMRTFQRVRTPALDDVRVDWGGLEVEQAPTRTPPVFAGDALTVLARIERGQATEVSLIAGERRFTAPIDLERASAGGPLPVLWARERIRELEDGERRGSAQQRGGLERRKAAIVELATRYGLASSETSFVAVEERPADARATEPAALRRIPVALTRGWGGGSMASGVPMRSGVASFAGAAPPPRAPSPAAMSPGAPMPKKSKLSKLRSMLAFEPLSPADELAAASDRVFDLLMTQKADGRFVRSPLLEQWLGSSRAARLLDAIRDHGEASAVTAVVVALLAKEAPERESEWRPAVRKAEAWLAKQGARIDATLVVGAPA
jgi:Ca-activated chloride channel family protein